MYRAQLAAADFVVLNKLDLVPADSVAQLIAELRGAGMRGQVLRAEWARVPIELLFSAGLHEEAGAPRGRAHPAAERFETMSWTSERPVSFPMFQEVIGGLAPMLVRAKGILALADQPGRSVLFQLTGQRATLAAGPAPEEGQSLVRLVLIFEIGRLDPVAVRRELDRCVAPA